MKHFIALSLFFVFTIIWKGGNSNTTVKNDSYRVSDSTSLKALEDTTKTFGRQKKYDSATVYARKLLWLATAQFDSLYMANANHRLGFYKKKKNQLDSAFFFFNQSLKISINLNDSLSAGQRLLDMANIQKGLGDFDGSNETAVDGLKYLNNTQQVEAISGLNHVVSVSFKELGDYSEALRWNDKALNTALPGKEHERNIRVFNNTRANILARQQKYPQSVSLLRQLLKDANAIDSKIESSRILCNLGVVKWLEDPDNTESEALLLQSLEEREKLHTVSGLISSHIHLAEYYTIKNPTLALEHASKAQSYGIQLKNPMSILEALGLQISLKDELKLNATAEAILYKKINERLQETKRKINSIYVTTKYENDELSQRNLLLKEVADKKEKQNTIYLFSILLLSVAGAFLWYYFKQRNKHLQQENKTARLEASHETEAELSRRLHDGIGATLNHGMSLVQNNADKSEILDILDSAYQQSRDFSREINDVETGTHYSEELLGMLGSRKAPKVKLFISGLKQLDWTPIPTLTKTTLYKVLQELMINMGKHSQAEQVSVVFKKTATTLEIHYADDGVGASKSSLITKNGLRNTEKRIQAIGGSITFDSETGKGFKATIAVPQ